MCTAPPYTPTLLLLIILLCFAIAQKVQHGVFAAETVIVAGMASFISVILNPIILIAENIPS